MLEVKSLSCRRGRRLVFRRIGFKLAPGGLMLVTGRNGCGKSSLLRVLAGLAPACDGAFLWDGKPVTDFAEHRGRLHYIGHLDAVKPELTVKEMLAYWRALARVPVADMGGLEPFGLVGLRDRPVRYLSAGQKRRLALARLTLRKAPLWLLDEPATALDDAGRKLLTDLVVQHQAEGGMAVIATHQKMDFREAGHLALDGAAA